MGEESNSCGDPAASLPCSRLACLCSLKEWTLTTSLAQWPSTASEVSEPPHKACMP